MSRALILTYKGEKFGHGHYQRSMEIAKQFQALSIETSIVNFPDVKNIELRCTKDDIVLVDVPFQIQDLAANSIEDANFSALDWISNLRIPTLNFVAHLDSKYAYSSAKSTFSGSEYFIFPKIETNNEYLRSNSKKTLIALGSHAEFENINIACEFAMKLSDSVSLVGYTTSHQILQEKFRLEYLGYVENLPSVMKDFNSAITNGGISMMQSLYLGLQTYSFPQNIQELSFVENFALGKSHVVLLEERNQHLAIKQKGKITRDKFRHFFDLKAPARIVNSLIHEHWGRRG